MAEARSWLSQPGDRRRRPRRQARAVAHRRTLFPVAGLRDRVASRRPAARDRTRAPAPRARRIAGAPRRSQRAVRLQLERARHRRPWQHVREQRWVPLQRGGVQTRHDRRARAGRAVRQVADGIALPNRMVVSPDNKTLIVAESFTGNLVAFDISPSVRGGRPGRPVPQDGGEKETGMTNVIVDISISLDASSPLRTERRRNRWDRAVSASTRGRSAAISAAGRSSPRGR